MQKKTKNITSIKRRRMAQYVDTKQAMMNVHHLIEKNKIRTMCTIGIYRTPHNLSRNHEIIQFAKCKLYVLLSVFAVMCMHKGLFFCCIVIFTEHNYAWLFKISLHSLTPSQFVFSDILFLCHK